MSSNYFQPLSASHSPEQEQAWHARRRTAETALAQQVAAGAAPDAEAIAHFQAYVSGDISLGQAIGRVLDKLSRTSRHPSLWPSS